MWVDEQREQNKGMLGGLLRDHKNHGKKGGHNNVMVSGRGGKVMCYDSS